MCVSQEPQRGREGKGVETAHSEGEFQPFVEASNFLALSREGTTGARRHDLQTGVCLSTGLPPCASHITSRGLEARAGRRAGQHYHGAEGGRQLVDAAGRREDEHLVAQGLGQLAEHELQHFPVGLLRGGQPVRGRRARRARSSVCREAAAWPLDPRPCGSARSPEGSSLPHDGCALQTPG